MKAGVTLNPHTPVSLLEDIISELDLVLLMSVNPGFGGQTFIENTYKKIHDLKEMILRTNSKALIEVDGGVTDMNSGKLYQSGVDVLVAGSYVFHASDPAGAILKLKK
jgi:ribulose-phosphate 3-epimerase